MEANMQVGEDVLKNRRAGLLTACPRRGRRLDMKNPYQIDRYATSESDAPGGVRGAVSRAAGMLGCLVAMGVLFIGTICMLWRVAGR